MYSFDPTEEQQMLVDAVNKYAVNDLRPAAREAEENNDLPKKLVSKGWELGLLQASIPESYGGFGERSAVTGALALEEMAFGDLAGTLAVMTPSLFATPILMVGSEEQKKTYLPKIIAGDWNPYTAALIEYAFDFDPNDLKTTATLQGENYILNGEKAFVPFARGAESILVYANLDGQSQAFIVEKEAEGLSVSDEREKLMSLNALPMYRVKLEDVKIPVANRLGGAAGHDFEIILASMRIANAATAVGVANAAFEYARDYAKEREAFGVKIVTDRAVQILGGHGYIREHPVEMWMRNGRGFAMFTGLAIV